jgi:anthranilate synthase component 2
VPVRILLVDNYDSFTFNLVQAFRVLGAGVDVVRNDTFTAQAALARPHDAIVVSPGPCTPTEAGISVEVCRLASRPLLGVCLGHQCLIAAFGGRVGRAEQVRHGKTSPIQHDGCGVFRGLPDPLVAARYHSLVALDIPSEFTVSAREQDRGECMAVRHENRPLVGVQFHPESFLTPDGPRLLHNFLELAS